MKNVLNLLTEEMKCAFHRAGFESEHVEVSLSRRPELCDFQCNSAFKLAKEHGVKPSAIAERVIEPLSACKALKSIEVEGAGFINLTLDDAYLINRLEAMRSDDQLGVEKAATPQNIILDFGGANVAKALHVGHLRSAVIGESLKELLKFKGHHVVGDIHLGDWGLQMGLVIEKLRMEQPTLCYFDAEEYETYPEEPPFNIGELTRLYTEANVLSKNDAAFRAKAADTTAVLQRGHKAMVALWHHILSVSKADLKANYAKLGVHFDLWLGESDSQEAIPFILNRLQEEGLLVESQGAKVVYVENETDKKPVPPCIIQKENGAVLYATTDLATLHQRMENIGPNRVVYVVDKRQALHFEQVFRVARLAKLVPDDVQLDFIGFGTMNGSDGKPFKTRDGGVMALEDLIVLLRTCVEEKLAAQSRAYNSEEIDQTALSVGVAALKFADLSNQPERDYVFDIEQFSSFEGKTGPYIQYAGVRAKSILKKLDQAGVENGSLDMTLSAVERDLAFHLMLFDSWVEIAVNSFQPSKICDYVFELAQRFNRFYHDTHIVGLTDYKKQTALKALVVLTDKVIEKSLSLLGIDAIEKM